jgi:hypothetical protein
MLQRITAVLAFLLLAPSAMAASRPDLAVSITGPSSSDVYVDTRYDVTVSNIGNKDAANVVLEIELPQTHTSPTVHVMGLVGAMSGTCALSGTRVTCGLSTIKKGKFKAVYFRIALPVSSVPQVFDASASTTTYESALGNNDDSFTAQLNYVPTAVGAPRDVINRHCTGTDLTGFLECVLSPGSIMSHEIQFLTGGGIDFPAFPGLYSGAWSQPTPDSLTFEYYDGPDTVMQFEGYGVGGDCFEGITTFPGSTWNSAYEVCLQ